MITKKIINNLKTKLGMIIIQRITKLLFYFGGKAFGVVGCRWDAADVVRVGPRYFVLVRRARSEHN